jgi:hypothetical protein
MLNRLPSRSSANWQPTNSCCIHDASDGSASAQHNPDTLFVFKRTSWRDYITNGYTAGIIRLSAQLTASDGDVGN